VCGSTRIVWESGSVVCSTCGAVLEENVIDDGGAYYYVRASTSNGEDYERVDGAPISSRGLMLVHGRTVKELSRRVLRRVAWWSGVPASSRGF
jgi:transcription initiation factor TFIIIB Brf1 subunit/transcription initiation factor TFIIB